MSYLYLVGMLSSLHHDKYYDDLTEEEKLYVDTVDKYLFFEDDQKLNTACSRMMFLILKASVTIGTSEEMSEDEVLKEEEKQKVDDFTYSCIQCMGIYSEERVNERMLKRERK